MKTLQNEKVNIKVILAALWIAVMFILYCTPLNWTNFQCV